MAVSHAILLTASAPAAIAVVRLTGPVVAPFLREHFSRSPVVGKPTYGRIFDGDVDIDDGVVYLHAGRPIADLNIHGGHWTTRRILNLAGRNGFTIISHDEMPLDETDGRDDLQRRINRDLSHVTTPLAVLTLLAQNSAWRHPHHSLAVARANRDRSLYWLLHPPRLAIVGAPNVGKSSLANRLFARDRSITSDQPGTTRDWIAEPANLDGLPILLIDTPGIRLTSDEIERAGIQLSQDQIESADLVLLVLDPTQPADPDQRPLLARFPNALVILNKSDKSQTAPLNLADLPLKTVATTGQGIPELRRAIRRRFLRPWRHICRPRSLQFQTGGLPITQLSDHGTSPADSLSAADSPRIAPARRSAAAPGESSSEDHRL